MSYLGSILGSGHKISLTKEGSVNTPAELGKDPDHPFTVAQLSQRIVDAVTRWGSAWVEGELIKFQHKSGGHAYPNLRDLNTGATIPLVIFNGVLQGAKEEFQDGDRVLVNGVMDYYVPTGKLSLKVSAIKKIGLGVLMAEIEAFRAKIIAEGLADPLKKKKLPFLPNAIGLITAQNSDAEKDVKQNVLLRWPEAVIKTISVSVQGADCPPSVIAALKQMNEDPDVDVIIIARGGGGFLDLVGFSDEALVRAVAASKKPVISAIGHENDRPIIDEVSDLRASTPTDAAKRVVPDVVDERNKIREALARMENRIAQYVSSQLTLLQQIRSHPMLRDPHAYLDQRNDDLTRAISDLRDRMDYRLERQSNELTSSRSLLRSLSPQSTLDRGYSVVRTTSGEVVTDPKLAPNGTELTLTLAKGEIKATAK
ncbi:MAG: exodeoxyribonuclease VII large subunit [Micrococcales bacterium]|nr:exodeoxyribonuclease VII large subunit [Micrococcales bacterium]